RGPATRHHKRLALTLALVLLYMGAEVVGGIVSGSLALLADAGHMLSDAGSLGLALFALWFARRPAPPERTYGYYRAEILAALAHGGTLVAVAVWIFYEAWQRFRDPPAVEGGLMMAIAAGGFVINLLGLWILRGGRKESLNIRGAWLHVLADALGSVQALAAGALILAFDWRLADPIASVLIGILVAHSAWRLSREAVAVLMEGAPGHVDVDEVRDAIREIEGVEAVHDLHVWTITTGFVALSCHVVASPRARRELLSDLGRMLEDRFRIAHTTIQVEPTDFQPCGAGENRGGDGGE
ncbi:MAG: cation diffusion facilitator family transporter, partial [Gemmatimonadota bacterium]